MSRQTITASLKAETVERLKTIAGELGLNRSDLVRRLVEAALRNDEAIERWKDAVLGPRFEFMTAQPAAEASPPPQIQRQPRPTPPRKSRVSKPAK